MLIRCREIGEAIIIGDKLVKIIVLAVNRNTGQVKLGFEADRTVEILRSEIKEGKPCNRTSAG